MNVLEPMMQFMTSLLPLREMLTSTWDQKYYQCFLQPHSTQRRKHMPSMSRHCAYQNGICTLTNIVIVDSTQTNLLPRSCATQGFAVSDAI
jgi:hypothetical protein